MTTLHRARNSALDLPFEPTPPSTNGSSPQAGRPSSAGAPAPDEGRHSPLLRAVFYLVLIAFVLPVLAGVIAAVAHLGPFANHIFPVTLHNDTTATVLVRACSTHCIPADQSVTLKPGDRVDIGVSDGAEVSHYYLHDPANDALTACLPVQASRKVTGVVVEISRAESCPGTPLSIP